MTSLQVSKPVTAVDLAARFSAVVSRGAGGEVVSQYDSSGLSPILFAQQTANYAVEGLLVVEDVPYGVSGQAQVKTVLRLQGMLIQAIASEFDENALDRVLFVNPSVWMKHCGGFRLPRSKESKAERERIRLLEMRDVAKSLGYFPPSLAADYVVDCRERNVKPKASITNALLKSETDYVAAWLISEWAYQLGEDVIRGTAGVQPVLV